jgi:hypothetical protein
VAQWSIPFDEIAKRQKRDIAEVVRASTLLMFSRVLQRSPVDTGRFRANWNVSYGSIDEKTTERTDPTGADSQASLKDAVLSMPVGGVAYFVNSLPYAMVLEYGLYPDPPKFGSRKRGEAGMAIHVRGGYSLQAPAGMVRITAREFAAAVQASLKAAA